MNYDQAKKYLESFINYEKGRNALSLGAFSLSRMKKLLKLMNNFQDHLKVVHIAGSKGKGSTAALTASILKEAGNTVGLYTSPHMNDSRERIRIVSLNKEFYTKKEDLFFGMISRRDFAQSISEVSAQISKLSAEERKLLTYFEVFTATALYYFYTQEVDWVVLETGLGGRLDATNVVASVVSVITTITYEHTQVLGNTLKAIAREKAAIIKSSTACAVIAPQAKEVEEVLLARCRKMRVPFYCADKLVDCQLVAQNRQKQDIRIYCGLRKKENAFFCRTVKLPLLGGYQRNNTAVALSVIFALSERGVSFRPQDIQRGIEKVYWPLRFELISQTPLILLDAAHTPLSARELALTVKEIFANKKIVLILAISSDKKVEAICRELNAVADKIYFTRYKGARAAMMDSDLLRNCFAEKECVQVKSVKKAFDEALKDKRKDLLILATGSLFLASEARRWVLKNRN